MTKTIDAALQTHLESEVTSLALLCKITLVDDTVIGLTDHDIDITYDNVTYESSVGFTASAIVQSADMSVDNLDIEGILDDSYIGKDDVLSGKIDYACVQIFLINYSNTVPGIITLKRGWIGEIHVQDDKFYAEVRGLAQALAQPIVDLITAECKAALGDDECGVTIATYTETGTVDGVTDRRTFADSGRTEADDYFNHGKLTWTGGDNSGLSMEVKDFANATGTFTLFIPMYYTIQNGDTYSVYAGCDKKTATCKNTFSNLVNFRGFPDVPTQGEILKVEGR